LVPQTCTNAVVVFWHTPPCSSLWNAAPTFHHEPDEPPSPWYADAIDASIVTGFWLE
jgi:hypothetical protein